jgi:hypothetical protein
MSRHALVAALVVSALAAGPARADTTIDTTPFWDGAQHVYPFGSAGTGSTPTYGQTVTVPSTDHRLKSFTFYLDVPTDVAFRAEVRTWDELTQTAGSPALWSGDATTTASYDASGGTLQAVTFQPGGLPLAAGQRVVLLLTTLYDHGTDPAPGYLGARWGTDDAYAGGRFVYSNQQTLAGLLGGALSSFDGTFTNYADAAFNATFGSGYAFGGFAAPVSETATDVARAGQAVPVAWTLRTADGAPVTDATGMSLSSTPCGGGAAAPVSAAGGSGWQSDGAGGWQVNWKTDKAWAGSCRMLSLTLPDGSVHSAIFSFR